MFFLISKKMGTTKKKGKKNPKQALPHQLLSKVMIQTTLTQARSRIDSLDLEETDEGLYIGLEEDEEVVESTDLPKMSSDRWMKRAHLNELSSVSTRGGNHKVNPMNTLPKFTPGEGHYEGSLVQKLDHEVPV